MEVTLTSVADDNDISIVCDQTAMKLPFKKELLK